VILAAKLGVKVPDNWPPKFVSALENRKELPWRIYYMVLTANADTPVLVGIAGLAPWSAEARTLQFGAALIPEHQRRHLGAELGAAIAEWALGVPEIDRVICEVPADHAGVAKALERAGYTREGIAPGPGFASFARHVRSGASGAEGQFA
jgi:RimJ/RimL family protein N-acetyltransferase